MTREVPRRDGLTVDSFARMHRTPCLPVVLTDQTEGWPARRTWTPHALAQRLGERPVEVHVLADGDAFTAHDTRKQPSTWRQLLDPASAGPPAYLIAGLLEHAPYLIDDVRPPSVLPVEEVRQAGIWVCRRGARTHLHYDSVDGFQTVLQGRKRVRLFPPTEHARLYPTSALTEQTARASWSRVDVTRPDLERFPAFAGASWVEVVLDPGDMLYIPARWWHTVGNEGEWNIAVNFWLRPEALQTGDVWSFYAEHEAAGGRRG